MASKDDPKGGPKPDAKPETRPEREGRVSIQADDAVAQGVYTNFALVKHSETEFVFDFVFLQPGAGKGRLLSRVISSPAHTKRLMLALRDNVEKYERRFGEIRIAQPPAGTDKLIN